MFFRKILLSAGFVFAFCSYSHAASYPLCDNTRNLGGKLFGLHELEVDQRTVICWREISANDEVEKSSLKETFQSFQFTYIFPDQNSEEYDKLFSVLVRELGDPDDSTPYVEIARQSLKTLCSKSGEKDPKARIWPAFLRNYPGYKFNQFHSSKSVTRRRLADFHVAYMNAKRECVRTDQSGDARKSFYIDGVEFPDVPEIRQLATIYEIFTQNNLFAFEKKPEYKRYRVKIRKAKLSETNMLSANFFVGSDGDADVRLQDLSSSRLDKSSILRPFSFKIR